MTKNNTNTNDIDMQATAKNILTDTVVTDISISATQQTQPIFTMGSNTAYGVPGIVANTYTITTTGGTNNANYVVYNADQCNLSGYNAYLPKLINVGKTGKKGSINFIVDVNINSIVFVGTNCVETAEPEDEFTGNNSWSGAPQLVSMYKLGADQIAIAFADNAVDMLIGKAVNKLALKNVVSVLNQAEVKHLRIVKVTGLKDYKAKIDTISEKLKSILGVEIIEN